MRPSNLEVSHAKRAFGYFGSKFRIASKIIAHLPPHNAWVEAFCGSISLTLAKRPAPLEVVNDINEEIVNFFRQLRQNPKKLCELVSLTPYSKQELRIARLNTNISNPTERARRFLVLSMMAINGVFGEEKGGFSFSNSYVRGAMEARVNRWYNLPSRLMDIVERLRQVRIENCDAIDLIKSFSNRPATLVYLDPPYLAKRTSGYDNDANCEIFHKKLIDLIRRANCMVVLSGYDNDLYRQLLKNKEGWECIKIDSVTRSVNGKNLKREELLWRNRQCLIAEKNGRPPIRLSPKEKKGNKINPIRNEKIEIYKPDVVRRGGIRKIRPKST